MLSSPDGRHVRTVPTTEDIPRHCPMCNTRMPPFYTYIYTCGSLWRHRVAGGLVFEAGCPLRFIREAVRRVELT